MIIWNTVKHRQLNTKLSGHTFIKLILTYCYPSYLRLILLRVCNLHVSFFRSGYQQGVLSYVSSLTSNIGLVQEKTKKTDFETEALTEGAIFKNGSISLEFCFITDTRPTEKVYYLKIVYLPDSFFDLFNFILFSLFINLEIKYIKLSLQNLLNSQTQFLRFVGNTVFSDKYKNIFKIPL